MTIYRIDIEDTKSVDEIATSFALSASAVFDDRFPGEEGREQWEAAMAAVVRAINEHVRSSGPPPR